MAIFTHLTVGANDLEKAGSFYDATLTPLGLKRLGGHDKAIFYGEAAPELLVLTPADGKPATAANGGTIGLKAPSRAAVDAFHAGALSQGGVCAGPPGPRPFAPNAYCAYVRDPEGNKLAAVCMAPE